MQTALRNCVRMRIVCNSGVHRGEHRLHAFVQTRRRAQLANSPFVRNEEGNGCKSRTRVEDETVRNHLDAHLGHEEHAQHLLQKNSRFVFHPTKHRSPQLQSIGFRCLVISSHLDPTVFLPQVREKKVSRKLDRPLGSSSTPPLHHRSICLADGAL